MSLPEHGYFEDELDEKCCIKWTAPYFEFLKANLTAAVEATSHPDPKARMGALLMLRKYWHAPIEGDLAGICEKIGLRDTDINTRCLALTYLAADCDEGDLKLGKMFCEIVQDKSLSRDVRYVAYLGLHAVRGTTAELAALLPLDFPDCIDWDFVNSFRPS